MSRKKFKLDMPSSLSDFKDSAFMGNTTSTTTTSTGPDSSSTMSMLARWVPLICAGAAVGVSVIALKEIKNVRKDLMNMKKDQPVNKETDKKIEETSQISNKL